MAAESEVGNESWDGFYLSCCFVGDAYYHFGGRSKYSDVPPWYLRANLTWWQFDKILFIDLGEAVLLGLRIGRDFNVTENFGVSIDGESFHFLFCRENRFPFYLYLLSASVFTTGFGNYEFVGCK